MKLQGPPASIVHRNLASWLLLTEIQLNPYCAILILSLRVFNIPSQFLTYQEDLYEHFFIYSFYSVWYNLVCLNNKTPLRNPPFFLLILSLSKIPLTIPISNTKITPIRKITSVSKSSTELRRHRKKSEKWRDPGVACKIEMELKVSSGKGVSHEFQMRPKTRRHIYKNPVWLHL